MEGDHFTFENDATDKKQCDGERIHCENNFGSVIRYINSITSAKQIWKTILEALPFTLTTP